MAYNINSKSVILSAILLGTVGVFSFIVQPGLVQGFVTQLGVSEAGANGLAAAEMGGIALATLVAAILSNRVNWRLLIGLSLLIATIGNLASALIMDVSHLGVIRFLTGIGSGGIIGLSFAVIGLTDKPEKNLALYLTLLLIYGAIGLWLMPTILETIGLKGIFLIWTVLTALALFVLRYLPKSSENRETPSPTAIQFNLGFLAFALLGILAYNTAIGLAWANLFLIGLEVKPDEQAIANSLLLSQFIAIPGALMAVFMSDRFGRWIPYTMGIIGGMLSIFALWMSNSFAVFVIAVCAFNFLWNMVLPYILASVNDMDEKSRMVTPAISMQMMGLFIGPFLGAIILGQGANFQNVKLIIVGLFIVSFIILAICLQQHGVRLKRKITHS